LFFRFISFLRNYLVFIWTNDVFLPVFRILWIRITCVILRTIRSFSFGSTVLLLALTRLLALRFSFDQYFFLFIWSLLLLRLIKTRQTFRTHRVVEILFRFCNRFKGIILK